MGRSTSGTAEPQ